MTLPIIMTAAGLLPRAPADIRADILARAIEASPGLTGNLPGSLVEDMVSTSVAAVVVMDQARVDTVNSVTPYGANAFLVTQLGTMLGIPIGAATRTSVNVQFAGPPGYVIPIGFTVGDGTHHFEIVDGGIVASSGFSPVLSAVASQDGSYAVPASTVVNLETSVPTDIALTVTNPQAGTPGGPAQTIEDYRSQVLQAQRAPAQGMSSRLRTLLLNVPGVQPRLISVRLVQGVGWEVIVGGGDVYLVAKAIFDAVFDLPSLTGSILAVEGITNADPGVVTTALTHGFSTGQIVQIAGLVGMGPLQGTPLTATVLSSNTISIGEDTTGFPPYVSGGVVTPNLRNVSVTISDPPDTYVITFVQPPQQWVAIDLQWNTSAVNFVAAAAVNSLGSQSLVNYINGLPAGHPINLFELQATFQQAVTGVLPVQFLTRMVFAVSINGVGVAASTGTGIIAGDPESYFETASTSVFVTQG